VGATFLRDSAHHNDAHLNQRVGPTFWCILWVMFIILGILSLAFAVSTHLQAPTLFLWKVSIAATEFGYIAALPIIALGLLALTPRLGHRRWYLRPLFAIPFFVAGGILFQPAIQSARLAKTLNSDLVAAFGPKAALENEAGFSWLKAYFSGNTEAVKPELIEFKRPDGSSGLAYFYHAQAQAVSQSKSPLLVVIHGGAWNSGDPLQLPELNSIVANEGYAVVAINYRFIPEFKWPTQKNDVLAGIDYIRDHADQFGVDPNRVVILGRSAGGQIAEAIAYDPPDNLRMAIRGCIGFYSPADLNFAYRFGRDDDVLSSLTLLRQYMGGTPDEKPQEYHTASPIDFVGSNTPPTLLIHGEKDVLVWFKQSERLRDKMKIVKRPVFLLDLPWATHGFDFNIHGPGGQLSTESVLAFMKAVSD
jgi:acetyl esterase/lipase